MIEDARGNIDYDEEGSGPQPATFTTPTSQQMLSELGSERIEREWRGGVSAPCGLERILNPRTTSF
jgi:hypothetical protein